MLGRDLARFIGSKVSLLFNARSSGIFCFHHEEHKGREATKLTAIHVFGGKLDTAVLRQNSFVSLFNPQILRPF